MKQFDKFAKFGEPLMFIVLFVVLLLAFASNIEELRLWLKPNIIAVCIILGVLSLVGFILNSRKIKLDSIERKARFEAMLTRHDEMLKSSKDK